MARMTAEEKSQVPGGAWSVLSGTGKVLADCATELAAQQECTKLSRAQGAAGPYTVARLHDTAIADQAETSAAVSQALEQKRDALPTEEVKQENKSKAKVSRWNVI